MRKALPRGASRRKIDSERRRRKKLSGTILKWRARRTLALSLGCIPHSSLFFLLLFALSYVRALQSAEERVMMLQTEKANLASLLRQKAVLESTAQFNASLGPASAAEADARFRERLNAILGPSSPAATASRLLSPGWKGAN